MLTSRLQARLRGRASTLSHSKLMIAALVFATGLAAQPAFCASATASAAPGTGSELLFSPYKYAPRNWSPQTNRLQLKINGTPVPLVGEGNLLSAQLPDLGAITLAFATGRCLSERWVGMATADLLANVRALARAGVKYVISTGGAGAIFTCPTPEEFVNFVRRYMSPQMVGIDFDTESGETAGQIKALIADAVVAEKEFPGLRFSFTLSTSAGSDGSFNGLSPLGDAVLKAIKASGLDHFTINLMVMDYGPGPDPHVCVVVDGACDMGQSAIQAARNLQHVYGIPASKIELTADIGVNDVPGEVFTLADMDTMIKYAVSNGLAGVHFWALDRDMPCHSPYSTAIVQQPCSSTDNPPLAYTKRALHDLGR